MGSECLMVLIFFCRKEQLVGFFSCCVAAQLPRCMESMRLLVKSADCAWVQGHEVMFELIPECGWPGQERAERAIL